MMTFDRNFARLLLEICRYTYAAGFGDAANNDDAADSLKWIENEGGLVTDNPVILRGSGTSVACIASYPNRNIVAYMGTKTQFNTVNNAIDSFGDWLHNFEVEPVPFALTDEQLGADCPLDVDKNNLGGLVHKGFLEELAAVQSKVVKNLLAQGGRGRPVYVTGHSQGGAEAALATRALLAGGFPVVSTYTFAAPRAGNLNFVTSIPATLPIHRIEFGDDIVPHVPPVLVGKTAQTLAQELLLLPFLSGDAKKLLEFIQKNAKRGYVGLGALCYGSNKTQALRVDLSQEQETELFFDRLWSLIRHPDRWAEHHHLAGTSDDVKKGKKGNYTALVSNFSIVK